MKGSNNAKPGHLQSSHRTMNNDHHLQESSKKGMKPNRYS